MSDRDPLIEAKRNGPCHKIPHNQISKGRDLQGYQPCGLGGPSPPAKE